MKNKRPSWDEYFMKLAHEVKERSNCIRMKVGVVLVKDRQIIATGYNGTPKGIKNCIEGGCQRCLDRHNNRLQQGERKDLCICVHAEENAILQSAYHGVSTKGAVMYSTIAPCAFCAKSIINAGISEVIYQDNHPGAMGESLLQKAGVKVRNI